MDLAAFDMCEELSYTENFRFNKIREFSIDCLLLAMQITVNKGKVCALRLHQEVATETIGTWDKGLRRGSRKITELCRLVE